MNYAFDKLASYKLHVWFSISYLKDKFLFFFKIKGFRFYFEPS